MDEQNVATIDREAGLPLPPLEMLRSIQLVITDTHTFQIDHGGGPDQKAQRQIANKFPAAQEVSRSIKVSGDMERGLKLLSSRLIESEPLDPAHRGTAIPGEPGRMDRKILA